MSRRFRWPGGGRRWGRGHLDPERAALAAALIQPRIAIPIHWGTLTAGAEGPVAGERAPGEFARAIAREAPEVEVKVLAPGERLDL
jgi:L-ascorbate metabolism protein UlaG (beta-lactamase superfamily)